MVTTYWVPIAIGAEGVITSLFAGHWLAVLAAAGGAQAGGSGLLALTVAFRPASCACGSGSSWPFGSPGYVGCTNLKVAGWPLIRTEFTVMSGPAAAAFGFLRSKSTLKSFRHCVAFCVS